MSFTLADTNTTANSNNNNVISHLVARIEAAILLQAMPGVCHNHTHQLITSVFFFLVHSIIRCSQLAVSIIAPALLDSSSQPDRPTAEASTSPAPSPKPQGETQPCNGVPARLTGRHFLGKRETDSDCKVCSQHKRKRLEEEERERKKQKTEEDEEPQRKTEKMAEEAKGMNSHDE